MPIDISDSTTNDSTQKPTEISNPAGEKFVQDVDELDDEDELSDEDDPFRNQFMRIEIPASQLKDVSKVKKDVDHDKPRKKNALMGGLQRAVSTVRIAENSKSKNGIARKQVLSRTNSTHTSVLPATNEKSSSELKHDSREEELIEEVNIGSLERPRESTAVRPGMRQSLAGVGRIMSLSRQRSMATGESDLSDRPRTSQTSNNNQQRNSISQVGRMLSRSRSRVVDETKSDNDGISSNERKVDDRATRNDRPLFASSSRRSIAKIGRMMSLTRSKSNLPTESTENTGETPKSDISPMSTSTVSNDSNAPDSTTSDRSRSKSTSSASGMKRATSRMNLKAAGRMLSFSRKLSEVKGKEKSSQNGNEEGQSAPGGKPDGRADKFFFVEIKSPEMRDSDCLENTAHLRVPVIAMAEYSGPVSKTKWYLDGFTLPHNAVRRECVDLYEILAGFAKASGHSDISRADVGALAGWWRVAGGFIKCYFAVEREILLPWVDAAGTTDWEIQLALTKMRSMKAKLESQLNVIDGVWGDTKSTPGDLVARLYRAVDEFVPRLMNYFADQEILLPAIVKGYYTLEDRLRMDRDMVAAFGGDKTGRRERENAHHDLVLLVRWMPNARQLRAWIGKNLNSTARSMYPKWYSMWEEEHLQFVKTVRARNRTINN